MVKPKPKKKIIKKVNYRVISIAIFCIALFFLLLTITSPYKIFNISSTKKTVTPTSIPIMPTATTIPPTPTIIQPTKVYVTPTPSNTPTPSISPTPGEFGFEMAGNVQVSIAKGSCGEVFNVTSKGSTEFHIDSFPFPNINWQQSRFTVKNQEAAKLYLCVENSYPSCGGGSGANVTVHDDTTRATKGIWVNVKINC